MNSIGGGDDELPGTIGAFLRLFAIASFVAHSAAAFGVAQRRRWGRTLSLVVNYLTFVVAVVAVIHQLGGFTAVGKLGTGGSPESMLAGGAQYTLNWAQYGSPINVFTYDEPQTNSEVVRASHHVTEKVVNSAQGTLIATQYS